MWDKIKNAIVGFFGALLSALLTVGAFSRLVDREEPVLGSGPTAGRVAAMQTQREDIERAAGENEGPAHRRNYVLKQGWTALPPPDLPKPTYWPIVMSVGIVLLLWGFVTSPFILGLGFILFVMSLAGWIGDIRHESE